LSGIGSFHALKGSPFTSQVKSDTPMAYGKAAHCHGRGLSFCYCRRSRSGLVRNLSKIAGAMMAVVSSSQHSGAGDEEIINKHAGLREVKEVA
jgi:hypothetical protein